MKSILGILILFLYCSKIFGQNSFLIPFKKEGQWGYMNEKKEIVIQPKFQSAHFFDGERALIQVNNKYGQIDKSGKYVYPPVFDKQWVLKYPSHLFAKKDSTTKLYGFINSTNNWIIKPQFFVAEDFNINNSFATVQLNSKYYNWTIIDSLGKFQIPIQKQMRSHYQDWLYTKFHSICFEKGKLFGLKDLKEDTLLAAVYQEIIPLQTNNYIHGYLQVMKDNKLGLIEISGKEIVPIKYDRFSFEDGNIIVQTGKKFGVIDTTGKEIIPIKYEQIKYIDKDFFMIRDSSNLYHVTNKQGTTIFERMSIKNGEPLFQKNNIFIFVLFDILLMEPKFYLTDFKGKRLNNQEYLAIGEFSEGLALVLNSDFRIGVIDTNGKTIIPFKYNIYNDKWNWVESKLPHFENGFCFVKRGDTSFYIDKKGIEYTIP
jgi:hypothetical protein